MNQEVTRTSSLSSPTLLKFFPFLRWFPLRGDTIKADLMAGITVALILIPQSMAYAQLAGLPAYYGLYAAFLPGIVAAMWGSSAQLATGPVAVASLLTASALAPLAATASDQFIALAILLTLLVGIIQLVLGVFKLGVIVNFLSHPVIVGFTNAAAIIIGLSQLNKIIGVSMGRSEHFIPDIWGVILQVGDTHIPTLVMGLSAILIMWSVKKFAPKLPGVLIAVALTTLVSWAIGFEQNSKANIAEIANPEYRAAAESHNQGQIRAEELNKKLTEASSKLGALEKVAHGEGSQQIATLKYEIDLFKLQLDNAEDANNKRKRMLRKLVLERVPGIDGQPDKLYLAGETPPGAKTDGHHWRVKKIRNGELSLAGGGEVVGNVPSGLPTLAMPKFSWDMISALISSALVISLVAFMEAISIAKAMAAKTKDRIDPNQELIGQGLGNIVGSFSQAYPGSGSFSRSAVNLNSGAKTGMSSVFTGLIVLVALLFLTPLLYHLPQAVLAAIIMMAVVGLVNFKAIKHAWHAHKHDGVAAMVTFVATLAFAPHLDSGIMVGAGLAIVLYLYRTMSPRVAILGRYSDGTLRDVKVNNLPTSEHVIAMRFDGSLYFANTSYFEDTVLEAAANSPKAKFLLVVGDAINQLDASGEEVIHHLVDRLKSNGVTVVFSGLKKQVLDVMRHTGLFEAIGSANIFANEDMALESIYKRLSEIGIDVSGDFCLIGKPAAPTTA
jgi:SulP family sulfate permease